MGPIPYSCQDIDEADIAAVTAVLRSGFLTQGPRVPAFEAAFADRHRVPHAIAVSNATAALHIACLALDLQPGGRLWTTPNSFVASANCALYCGAEVGFVDIDPVTRNMSVADLSARLASAEQTGHLPDIVVPVNFAGLPADLPAIRALADHYGFKILEDASHATGASLNGQPVGSDFADISVFSFHAVKIVTTGEGGMLTTRDPVLAERLGLLRSHGITRDAARFELPVPGAWHYEQQALGFNYRMTDIQAALGESQLGRLDAMHAARVRHADRYDSLLRGLPLLLPARLPHATSAWHLYVVEVDPERSDATRAAVYAALQAAGISANLHYAPIHLQPYYRRLGFAPGDFPAAETYAGRALSIPLFPRMTDAQQDHVVATLAGAVAGRAAA